MVLKYSALKYTSKKSIELNPFFLNYCILCLSAITGKCLTLILSDTKQGTTTGKKTFPQACVLRKGSILPPTVDLSS